MTQYLPLFPSTSLSGYSAHKRPTFASLVQSPPSGREVTGFQQTYPLWEFELPFEILRDQGQNVNPVAPVVGFTDLQTFSTFWLSRVGQFSAFIYQDLDDCSRSLEFQGTGDAVTTSFPLVRTFGTGALTVAEPIGIADVRLTPTTPFVVYLDGVPVTQAGNWWIDTDLKTLKFATAPGTGVVIRATFSYFFLCRFIEDSLDIERFFAGRFEVKSLRFRSLIPAGGPYTIDDVNSDIITPQTSSTLRYFEMSANGASSDRVCIGLANASFNLVNPQALDFTAGNYASLNGGVFVAFGNTGQAPTGWAGAGGATPIVAGFPFTLTDVIGVAINTATRKAWWRNATQAPSVWYGAGASPTPDPVTGDNGYLLTSANLSGSIYALVGMGFDGVPGHHASSIVNFGATSFVATPPTGYVAWDSTTTMNPSDAAPEIVLSSGNLHVTITDIVGSNQPTAFVRSTTSVG